MFKKIINLNKNGYIFTKVLKDNNIPTVYLTRLCKKGLIKKLSLNPPLPKRSIGCAYLKNAPLSYAAKAFMDLIK